MKKLILVFAISGVALFTSCASFKDQGLNDYYSFYEKKVDKVKLPPILLNVLSGKEELKPILKYIKSAELVTINEASNKMKKNLESAIKYDQFHKYLNFQIGGEPITLYAIEENEVIKNIVFKIQSGKDIKLVDAKVNVPFSEFEKVMHNL